MISAGLRHTAFGLQMDTARVLVHVLRKNFGPKYIVEARRRSYHSSPSLLITATTQHDAEEQHISSTDKRLTRRNARRQSPTTSLFPTDSSGGIIQQQPKYDTRGQIAAHPETLMSRRASLQKDILMERIMEATNIEEILTTLERHLDVMNDFQVAMCAKRLRDFLHNVSYADLNSTLIPFIVNHSAFRLLCDRLHDRAYLMGGDTVVAILDFLRYCNVSMRTRIAKVYLNMLRQQIQTMDLNELFTAYSMLQKLPRVAIVDAMLTALPIACEMRYDNEIDPDYLPALIHALNYFGRIGMSESAKMKLANSLIQHTPHFTLHDATTVLRYAQGLPADEKRLLKFCCDMVGSEGLSRHRPLLPAQVSVILNNLDERGILSSRMQQRIMQYASSLRQPLEHMKMALYLSDHKLFDFKMLDRVANDLVNDLSLIETTWLSHQQSNVMRLFASAAYKPKNGSTMLDLLIGSSLSSVQDGQFLSENLQLLISVQYCMILRHWPSGLVNRLFSEPYFSELCNRFTLQKSTTASEQQPNDRSLRMMLALRSVVHIIDTLYPQHTPLVPQAARDMLVECTEWGRAFRYESIERSLVLLTADEPGALLYGIIDQYGCCFDYGIVVDTHTKAWVDIIGRRVAPPPAAGEAKPRMNKVSGSVELHELEQLQRRLKDNEKIVLIRGHLSSAYCNSHETRLLGPYLAQTHCIKLRGLGLINVRVDGWERLSVDEQCLYMRKLVRDEAVDRDNLLDPYSIDVPIEQQQQRQQSESESESETKREIF